MAPLKYLAAAQLPRHHSGSLLLSVCARRGDSGRWRGAGLIGADRPDGGAEEVSRINAELPRILGVTLLRVILLPQLGSSLLRVARPGSEPLLRVSVAPRAHQINPGVDKEVIQCKYMTHGRN
jgi:hypothetical protein